MNNTPFTYLIKFKPTGQVYYGVRYSEKCHPSELWNTYFTSSHTIHKLIEKYGKQSFEVEVRQIFTINDKAILWESKILKKFNAASNKKWLNRSNGDSKFRADTERTEEWKINQSKKITGRKHTEETIQKIREKRKLQIITITEEQKLKMSNSHMGKTHNNETKLKISVAGKGRKLSEEHKEKLRYTKSEETRKKLSEAAKGRVMSEETKQKISNTKKQKKCG